MRFARGSLASPTRGPVLLPYSFSSSSKEGQEVSMPLVSTLKELCLSGCITEWMYRQLLVSLSSWILLYSIHSSLFQLDLTNTLRLVQSKSSKYSLLDLTPLHSSSFHQCIVHDQNSEEVPQLTVSLRLYTIHLTAHYMSYCTLY